MTKKEKYIPRYYVLADYFTSPRKKPGFEILKGKYNKRYYNYNNSFVADGDEIGIYRSPLSGDREIVRVNKGDVVKWISRTMYDSSRWAIYSAKDMDFQTYMRVRDQQDYSVLPESFFIKFIRRRLSSNKNWSLK